MMKKDITILEEQYKLERKWRDIILNSEKGSDRKEKLKQAYGEVNALMELHGNYHKDLIEKAKIQFDLIYRLLPQSDIKFLDIGCSSGSLVIEALRKGWDAYGIDVEENSIQLAQKRYKEEFGASDIKRFYHGELEDLDINQFDIIFHSDVLEHIHPDEVLAFMQLSQKLLKTGGFLVINTPYKLSGPKDISKYFLTKGSDAQGLHLKEYLLKDMVRLYKDSGFSSVNTYFLNPSIYSDLGSINKLNTQIKLVIENILLIVPKFLRNKVIDSITGRLYFSLTIGVK